MHGKVGHTCSPNPDIYYAAGQRLFRSQNAAGSFLLPVLDKEVEVTERTVSAIPIGGSVITLPYAFQVRETRHHPYIGTPER